MSNEATKTTDNSKRHFFRASAADFKKIPGSPIAYWVSDGIKRTFSNGKLLGSIATPRAGLATGDNTVYQRNWAEVAFDNIAFDCESNTESQKRPEKWYPCNSGGEFRKWYGNNEVVVNWQYDGEELRNFRDEIGKLRSRPQNTQFFFKSGITWTKLSSSSFAARYRESGFIFDDTGRSAFPENPLHINSLLGVLCSKLSNIFLNILNPSMSFTSGDISNFPITNTCFEIDDKFIQILINLSKSDWDSYETSWNFTTLPLLHPDYLQTTLKPVGRISDSVTRQLEAADVGLRYANPTYPLTLSIQETYTQLRAHWQEMTLEMQRLEQENNRIFIDVYGLQDELKSDVPLNEITLTCNPHYRYGNNKNEEELETLLLADTMKEFISYAVGCMFGRYSLDKPGLILANQGDTIENYYEKIFNHEKYEQHEKENNEKFRDFSAFRGQCLFPADDDNVIPILDGDWFTDDITDRFCKFLKVTFGEEHYQENLTFIEKALGKDIRKYFLKDFYNDHLKRYKKRPIYWLFSSPKGSFNALIYMHRYRPDTVSVVLNDYLREFRTKLSARKNHLEAVSICADASPGEKTKALKEIESLKKMIDELDTYEREVLYPLATEQVEIDLDDGVKVNYLKFGEALKKIPGLAAKDEE